MVFYRSRYFWRDSSHTLQFFRTRCADTVYIPESFEQRFAAGRADSRNRLQPRSQPDLLTLTAIVSDRKSVGLVARALDEKQPL